MITVGWTKSQALAFVLVYGMIAAPWVYMALEVRQ